MVLFLLSMASHAGTMRACTAEPAPDPGVSAVMPVTVRPHARPSDLGTTGPGLRCTADRRHCISTGNYAAEVCRAIAATAGEAGLDVNFFARLLWQESRFNPGAVSPVGARGIAQFMPATARRRGLSDPFNPAEALRASAFYLAELRDTYGNLGLAAAAYNAGEARVEDFLFRDRNLPPETRVYVPAITGYSGLVWRDAPPEKFDFTLSDGVTFQTACEALARHRDIDAFLAPGDALPWAVIVAAHPERGIAQSRYDRLRRAHAVLGDHEISFVRMRLPAKPERHYTAQIGTESRKAANALCWQLRNDGVPCAVLHN
ncbi:lytic transglycosylase domain-containing protein [Tropicimonas sp.]|uniref:lytic transglycosylase domain-containing protein n=1 Tax=Tropicimonas sp. TaxID=2067044 RepID=UPI003A8A4729